MNAQTYTHRDLAKILGVSETTIKSYRSKFPTFLPVAREGKPVRLHPESLDVCLRIRELFANGLSILQTTQLLKAEFKEFPHNRRLSISSGPRAGAPLLGATPGPEGAEALLLSHIEALAKAQKSAHARMEQLESQVRNLVTMEAASKALVAELLAELRVSRGPEAVLADPASQLPPKAEPNKEAAASLGVADEALAARESVQAPSVLTARKIVTVHGRGGPVASYSLAQEPAPEPLFPEAQAPAQSYLALPAVIRSDRGDFLGLPGGQSVQRLVEVLSPEGAANVSWYQEELGTWTCAIPLGRAQTREILFERTTTPRGNLVGLIRRMRINEVEATPVQLQEIFRQLRDQMA